MRSSCRHYCLCHESRVEIQHLRLLVAIEPMYALIPPFPHQQIHRGGLGLGSTCCPCCVYGKTQQLLESSSASEVRRCSSNVSFLPQPYHCYDNHLPLTLPTGSAASGLSAVCSACKPSRKAFFVGAFDADTTFRACVSPISCTVVAACRARLCKRGRR